MRIELLIGLAACAGSAAKDGTADDIEYTADGCEIFDLDLWCFNSELAGGPSQTRGHCPAVTPDSLLADRSGSGLWRGRCTDPVHGELDFVNDNDGYGGPTWYFDAGGELVAFDYATDFSTFCDGTTSYVSYGFHPDCRDECVVTPPEDSYSWVTSGDPPC